MVKPECTGQGWDGDHCCYVAGEPCRYLRENVAGRRYACGLMLKYGSWEKVIGSPEYRPVGEVWAKGTQGFDYCATFNPVWCCRLDLNAGFRNPVEAHAAGYLDY